MKLKNKQAFTLIELIVTITILAILATIAFISFTGYSQDSRNSKRIADINSIEKSLGIYIAEKGIYPIPDNNANIIYSGAITWTEGTIGDNVMINIENINKKPLDPLTENEYTYSITSSKTEYEIGAISEGGPISFKLPVNQIYAATEKKATAYIKGTYNQRFIRTQSGTQNWILALPSIIATDITQTDLQALLNNKKLVYNNYSNIPHSYNNAGYTMTGGFEYTNTNPLIYTGTLKSLTEDDSSKLTFITNLQSAYAGTILQGEQVYKEIVNLGTEINQTKAVNLVNNYINSKLGGIGIIGTQKITNVTKCETGYIYNTEIDKCESEPICVSGYTFNITRNNCEVTPSCESGYTYNTGTKLCQKTDTVEASISATKGVRYCYNSNCGTTSSSSNYIYHSTSLSNRFGQATFDSNGNIISAGMWWSNLGQTTKYAYYTTTQVLVPGQTISFTTSYNLKNTTVTSYSCSSGYTLSGTTCSGILTESPICSNDGTFNTTIDTCQLNSTCNFGGILNLSNGKCQLDI